MIFLPHFFCEALNNSVYLSGKRHKPADNMKEEEEEFMMEDEESRKVDLEDEESGEVDLKKPEISPSQTETLLSGNELDEEEEEEESDRTNTDDMIAEMEEIGIQIEMEETEAVYAERRFFNGRSDRILGSVRIVGRLNWAFENLPPENRRK